MAMSKEKKVKISWVLIVLAIIANILVGAGFAYGWTGLFWCIAIANLVFGPVCLIFYLIEMKRGVFAYNEDEGDSIE